MTQKRRRITWTAEEEIEVLRAGLELYMKDPRSVSKLFVLAQEHASLPEARKRYPHATAVAKFHGKLRLGALQQQKAAQAQAAAGQPAGRDSGDSAQPQAHVSQRAAGAKTPAQPDAKVCSKGGEHANAEFAGNCSSRPGPCEVAMLSQPVQPVRPASDPNAVLTGLFLAMLELPDVRSAILGIVAEHYHVPPPVEEEQSNVIALPLQRRPRLPKIVLVTKLKGAQVAGLGAAFRGKLELYIWNTDRSMNELKARLAHCDAAVCTIDNCSHGAMQAARSRSPAFVPCLAGLESIKRELAEFVPQALRQEAR